MVVTPGSGGATDAASETQPVHVRNIPSEAFGILAERRAQRLAQHVADTHMSPRDPESYTITVLDRRESLPGSPRGKRQHRCTNLQIPLSRDGVVVSGEE